MAKPINATPTLHGKEAIKFLEKMKEREKRGPSKADLKLIDLLKSHSKYLQV